MSERDNSRQKYLGIAAAFVVVAIFAAILYLLFKGDEEYTSVDNDNIYSTEILYCEASVLEDPFFSASGEISSSHEIKVIYSQGKANKVSYTYVGNFYSEDDANGVNADLHAKYNKYMARYNLSPTILGPTFSVIGTKFKVNLYTDIINIDGMTGVLFFLNPDEAVRMASESSEILKLVYSEKGFDCKINNKQKEEDES